MIKGVLSLFLGFPNFLILYFKVPENFDQLHTHPNKTYNK